LPKEGGAFQIELTDGSYTLTKQLPKISSPLEIPMFPHTLKQMME